MGGRGPYEPPNYCEECGAMFPWTEMALSAAKEYTDDLNQLSTDEKLRLKGTFYELMKDTPRTAVAANRFKNFMKQLGPAAGSILQKLIETIATEAAKKSIGL